MTDENDKSAKPDVNSVPEPPKKKFIANPFSKLTDEDLARAMERGRAYDDAHDEWERKAISRAYQRKLVWVNRNGEEQILAAPLHDYDSPRISPDGRQVALCAREHIWLYDLSRETLTKFASAARENKSPVWTPDGKRIAFCSNNEGPPNIFWQPAGNSAPDSAHDNGGLERLTTSEHAQFPLSFSPDGQTLAFHESYVNTEDIWVMKLWMLRLSDRKAQLFGEVPFHQGTPRFSPDGRWLAYTAKETGRDEVYVQPYPGPGGKWQISTEGGTEPAWNPNGQELFYRGGTLSGSILRSGKMMAVDIATQPSFSASTPRVLFAGDYLPATELITNYDVSRDGQRFLMVQPPRESDR
jgi:eukaryotic-like serine/threonine-protein kinase